jgi:phosphate starvation-inducible PhoH-like protein
MAKDKSPKVHQRAKLNFELKIKELDWTDTQKQFIQLAQAKDTQIVFVKGRAGCSKTAVSIYCLLSLLNEKKLSDLVLVRPIVESAEQKIGFLPGTADDKIKPYMVPFFDKLDLFLSEGDTKKLIADHRVTAYPMGFLRGMDWNVKGVILDEAQNATDRELLTFMSRIGKFCKVFIVGDDSQADIKNSGFLSVYNLFNTPQAKAAGIHCFEFDRNHIMRSGLCQFITSEFDNYFEMQNKGKKTLGSSGK